MSTITLLGLLIVGWCKIKVSIVRPYDTKVAYLQMDAWLQRECIYDSISMYCKCKCCVEEGFNIASVLCPIPFHVK